MTTDIDLRPPVAEAPEEPAEPEQPEPVRPRWRRVLSAALSVLAFLLVLFALVGPTKLGNLTPLAFVRLPIEGLLAIGLILLLPRRTRVAVGIVLGVLLGLLTVLKLVDFGFNYAFDRPFDPVLDWAFLQYGMEFISLSLGRTGAIAAAVGAAALALALIALMPLAVLRLSRVATGHRRAVTRTVLVLGVVWALCAVLGVRFVADSPVASSSATTLAYQRLNMVQAGIDDQTEFAEQAKVDAFRDTPAEALLNGLRGKDVILTYVESYGRVALDDPQFGPGVRAVLDAGSAQLRDAGFASRSAFLTSSTNGGGSWLAHSTLMSGLWIDNQLRYRTLVASDRLTLNGAFRRAHWRTVGVMPAISQAWPEGGFFGYDHIYDANNSGYRGPKFFYATMPDQYTMSALHQAELARTDRTPVMAEVALLSSHNPFSPVPRLIDWDQVGDGSAFQGMPESAEHPEDVMGDANRMRVAYGHSIEYSLRTLITFMQTYGNDNLVLVFLGDHQPQSVITGDGAPHEVPITIVAKDPAVLDQISGWNWQDGLRPGPGAPVWRMDTFRDQFLSAFAKDQSPVGH
ncbi:sulfatase [Actinophytocola sp.]|uniref:sulfatase n=1 Tax=Actinophytocola sp. TaxID=1872138 RepID=UPI002D7FD195|nr:sulfatase [Actinophytocola sp.]HET9144439.1 sulfatase [Actinophytocola sp.]